MSHKSDYYLEVWNGEDIKTHKHILSKSMVVSKAYSAPFCPEKSRFKSCEDTKLIEFLLKRTFEKLKNREVPDTGQTDRI
jgi:hypothetical protein